MSCTIHCALVQWNLSLLNSLTAKISPYQIALVVPDMYISDPKVSIVERFHCTYVHKYVCTYVRMYSTCCRLVCGCLFTGICLYCYAPKCAHTVHIFSCTYGTYLLLYIQYISSPIHTVHIFSYTYSTYLLLYIQYISSPVHTVHIFSCTYSTYLLLYIQYISSSVHTVHIFSCTYGTYLLLYIQYISSPVHTVHIFSCTYSTYLLLYIQYISSPVCSCTVRILSEWLELQIMSIAMHPSH